jgi:uncharacterized heparinase superfamily protein
VNRLKLAVRTAAHLKPIQVIDRALRPIRRRWPLADPPLGIEFAGSSSLRKAWMAGPRADVTELLAGRVTFLGHCESLDRSIWKRRPHSDLWSFELQYFGFAVDLAAAYSSGGNARCLAALRGFVTDWIETTAGRAGDGWEAYPTAVRISNWLRALWILSGIREAQPLRDLMLPSLWLQVAHLKRNFEYHLLGNHLLKDLTAMAAASLCLEWNRAAEWREYALSRLWREIDEQFLSDGMHFERSPMYHDLALADCLEVVALCSQTAVPVPEATAVRLRLAIAATQVMRRSNNSFHAFNDCSRFSPIALDTLETLAAVAGLSRPAIGDTRSTALREAGYFGYAHEGDRLVVDAGPLGPRYQPGHGHCDLLSFELDFDGVPVIVDSGTSGYAEEPLRMHQRSTAGHNTLEFNGKEQAEIWSVFRVARRPVLHEARQTDDGTEFVGSYSPYHDRRIIHRRSIVRSGRGSLKISDAVEGPWRAVRGFLHFHPDVSARIEGRRVILNSDAGLDVVLESEEWSSLRLVRGAMDPPQGWYAEAFGRRVPTFALEYAPFMHGRDRCTITIRRA